jgi:cardiolipin synthase
MPNSDKINISDILLPSNLMSLSRILLTVPVGYFLWRGDEQATLICLILIVVAGMTDFLDGYLARRFNQITALGLILDPLADKIMTITVIAELVIFRGFPLWLALMIFARDIIILLAGLTIMRKKDSIPSSNLTGKYYFGSIAMLLISWIIDFDFGCRFFFYSTLVLFGLSSIQYGRIFLKIIKNRPTDKFRDRPLFKYGRLALMLAAAVIYFYRLYLDILAG